MERATIAQRLFYMSYVPGDFFSDTPPPRIMGSEMEYTISPHDEESEADAHHLNDAMEGAVGQVLGGDKSANRYALRNGGQLYVDYGDVVEYDTPECQTAYELALHEFAGHFVVARVAQAYESDIPAHAYTRVGYDHQPNHPDTVGYHENYLITQPILEQLDGKAEARKIFAGYLATRNVWSGAGIVGEHFRLGQKAHGVGGIQNGDTTSHGRKPMFRMLPESDNWFRLETRCTDANMSPEMTQLKFACTSLFLRLVEHNALRGMPVLHNTVNVMRDVSADTTFTKTYSTLDGGRRMSAVDYQQQLASRALRLSETIQLPREEVAAAQKWYEICDDLKLTNLKRGEFSGLENTVEWLAKYKFISNKVKGGRLNRYNVEAVAADLRWEEISPLGYGTRYWQSVAHDPAFAKLKLERRLYAPPATRAQARVAAYFQENFSPDTITWNYVKGTNDNGSSQAWLFSDPYDNRAFS